FLALLSGLKMNLSRVTFDEAPTFSSDPSRNLRTVAEFEPVLTCSSADTASPARRLRSISSSWAVTSFFAVDASPITAARAGKAAASISDKQSRADRANMGELLHLVERSTVQVNQGRRRQGLCNMRFCRKTIGAKQVSGRRCRKNTYFSASLRDVKDRLGRYPPKRRLRRRAMPLSGCRRGRSDG